MVDSRDDSPPGRGDQGVICGERVEPGNAAGGVPLATA